MKLKSALVIAILGKCAVLLWELWLVTHPELSETASWFKVLDMSTMALLFFVFYLKVRAGEEHE